MAEIRSNVMIGAIGVIAIPALCSTYVDQTNRNWSRR